MFDTGYPHIRQSEASECGLACVGMVLSYFGNKTTMRELRSRFSISRRGARLSQLIEMFEHFGSEVRAIKCDIDYLSKARLPMVLHWQLTHYVVLFETRRDGFIVADPAGEVRHISRKQLSEAFTGVALEVSTPMTPMISADKRPKNTVFSLLEFDWNSYSQFSKLVILTAFSMIFLLLGPIFLQLVIDDVVPASDISFLNALMLSFITLKVFEAMGLFCQNVVEQHIGATLNFNVGNRIYRHVLRMPLDYYYKRELGDVQQRISSVGPINDFVSKNFVSSFVSTLLSVVLVIVLFQYSIQLTAITVLFALFYIFLRLTLFIFNRDRSMASVLASAKKESAVLESINTIATLKITGQEGQRWNILAGFNAKSVNANLKLSYIEIFFSTANSIVSGFSYILIIYIGANMVIGEQFSIGMLTAFVAYKAMLDGRLYSLIEAAIAYKLLGVYIERVSDLIDTEPEPGHVGENRIFATSLQGSVRCESISFRYGTFDLWVFKPLDVDIAPGEKILLRGKSGSGKSTLVKVLSALFMPSEGQIAIDGKSLGRYNISSLRQHIGTVLQGDDILAGSLSENISGYDEFAAHKDIVEAARKANIHEFIQTLPMQYNTLMGDIGESLSGGQKQRVLLARAFYGSKGLLILDEITSGLDKETSKKVLDSLLESNATVILATHNLMNVEKFDRVLNFVNGVVKEEDPQKYSKIDI